MFNEDDLFKDVVLDHTPVHNPTIKKQCKYCFLWFETTNRYATRCREHIGLPERKLIKRAYKLSDNPF